MNQTLGKFDREYLEERSKSGIQVDAKTAVMTKADFDALREYSCTLPTGTYIGKRWKRALFKDKYGSEVVGWMMGEYAPNPDPKEVDIIWRNIEVVN